MRFFLSDRFYVWKRNQTRKRERKPYAKSVVGQDQLQVVVWEFSCLSFLRAVGCSLGITVVLEGALT